MAFDATTTAAEVLDGVDLSGRRMLVTGGSSGLGVETARALAQAGAEITIGVRDLAGGERVAAEIGAKAAPLDLADQDSVARFAGSWDGPLHALVANAGVMATPLRRTREGWELQFATNHLGHFALAVGLRDALAAAGDARIVAVSSVGHVNGDVDFEDINFGRRPYDPWRAYSQSKTANVLFAVEAARRWAGDGITANALNPGRIWATGLGRHLDAGATAPTGFEADSAASAVSVKDVRQGAATSVLLAGSPLVAGVTGRYFEDCAEAPLHREGIRRGVAAYAMDPERARRLWDVSTTMIAVTQPRVLR